MNFSREMSSPRRLPKTKMVDTVIFKMLSVIFLITLVISVSFSVPIPDHEEKCSCYSLCSKNFTMNSIQDVQKITACRRGCRFQTLLLHTSHNLTRAKSLKNAKEGCLMSCSESYHNPEELTGCKFGCCAFESSRILCNSVEILTPEISYSFLIEESDILIHPGEPEPDDSLTDPGLRKQIQKTLVALLDATPKIPEIKFKNLPVKAEKISELSRTSFKCPKFYGLDSKFEFRNGKIIIGDLYLFVGVFVFVVLCFLLGHHIETKNSKRHFIESRFSKKDFLNDREPPFKVIQMPDSTDTEILIKGEAVNFESRPYEIMRAHFDSIGDAYTYMITTEKLPNATKCVDDSPKI